MMESLRLTSHMSGASDGFMAALASEMEMEWCGGSWDARIAALRSGAVEVGWVCGLLHAELSATGEWRMSAMVAPSMAGTGDDGRPVYFGDVIVARDASFGALSDLAGATLAYNEACSLSGYRMLLDRLGTLARFGACIASGSHVRSIEMVATGVADVASIDSIVLAMAEVKGDIDLSGIRAIERLGPYPAPPIVVSTGLDEAAREDLVARFEGLASSASGRRLLRSWSVGGFARVADEYYLSLAAQ